MKKAKLQFLHRGDVETYLCPKSHFSKKKRKPLGVCLKLPFNFYELWMCSSRISIAFTDAQQSVVIRPDWPALLGVEITI